MTNSAGCNGLISAGSPPRFFIASRIAARSTTAGTPVKSCISTRLGVNAISLSDFVLPFHDARARMSSAFTLRPSSVRNRFSSRMRSENGRCLVEMPCRSRASRRKISYSRPPTRRIERLPKLFMSALPKPNHAASSETGGGRAGFSLQLQTRPGGKHGAVSGGNRREMHHANRRGHIAVNLPQCRRAWNKSHARIRCHLNLARRPATRACEARNVTTLLAILSPASTGAFLREAETIFFFNVTAATEIYTLSLHDAHGNP